MAIDNQQPETCRRVAFKEVVGTGIGAITLGVLVSCIGAYREKSAKNIVCGLIGGTVIGVIGIAGRGYSIYESTIGRLNNRSSPRGRS